MPDDVEARAFLNDDAKKEPTPTHSDRVGEDNGRASGSKPRNGLHALRAKIDNLFKSEAPGPFDLPEITRDHDTYPNGYPRLAAFIASDQSFLFFRRFSYLQARVLLNIQDQLREYENQLEEFDQDNSALGHNRSRLCSDKDVSHRRSKLLQEIENRYERYASIMSHASSFSLRANPSETDYKNLYNFCYNHDPVVDAERYFRHRYDLTALRPRGDTAEVDKMLNKWLLDSPSKSTEMLFRDKTKTSQDAFVIKFSAYKVMIAKGILVIIPLVALLVCPIYPLYRLSQREMTEGTLVGIMFIQIGFTCVFTGCVKFLTRARRHELFACAVAYMGVIVVFMSQTIQGSS
ncbi:hypothetical protein F4779DRAFT_218232 [Xylariaceae sp. FL0662B]|nr:hypothetical protein F4779DRAFT_218232 [Xylariaceae sp. FL0662B]